MSSTTCPGRELSAALSTAALWTAAFLTALVTGPAAAAPHSKSPHPERITRLVVTPASVTLTSPTERAGLLVLGTTASGRVRDLTASASLTPTAGANFLLEGARLAPIRSGVGRLKITARGLTAVVPIIVKLGAGPAIPSFKGEIVPLLARLGCSSGTCHGANSGKGGFRLSLRGYAPDQDFDEITRQLAGRRIAPGEPGKSLLLRKPLGELPHGGGKRIQPNSSDHRLLLAWLAAGAPLDDVPQPVAFTVAPAPRRLDRGESQHLQVRSRSNSGESRDVTDLTVFRSNDDAVATVTEDGIVTAAGPGSTAIQAKYRDRLVSFPVTVAYPAPPVSRPRPFPDERTDVDRHVFAALRGLNLRPSPPCTDSEFLRRVYVDVLGVLPTADEARAFLADTRPDRRGRLIEQVLRRPEYASVWALKLSDLFLMRKEHMGRKAALALHQWLTEQFLQNRPWDQLVVDLLTAKGPTSENPATLWWASRQMSRPGARGWVRHHELTGEITAQVFLGQRIQCAKCHNHPTERYTQDDYYAFAALFSGVNGAGKTDPIPETLVADDPFVVMHPRTNRPVAARQLDGSPLTAPQPGGSDRRAELGRWLTGPGSEMFSRNIVNRIWARLFGSGIVDPVDDLRSTNPPRIPGLLEALSRSLVAARWDLKQVYRLILNSHTYQASSTAIPENRIDTRFFSRYPVRRLVAEEILDAVAQVTGSPDRFATYPVGTRAQELCDTELPSIALDTFGRPPRVMPCDCERIAAPSLSQALALFNGDALQAKLKDPSGTIARLAKSGKPLGELVDELFLMALARPPDAPEKTRLTVALGASGSLEETLQDVLWALLNTKEFMFQH